jgi:hypothetical protein
MQLPGLQGFAYRFTIFFPLLSGATGRGIFSAREAAALAEFLNDAFGGCTVETVGNTPPLTGMWKKGTTLMLMATQELWSIPLRKTIPNTFSRN